jgi:ComF family protein
VILVDLALELLAPTRCAACDARVPPRALFCAGCAVSALPADRADRAGGGPDGAASLVVFAYGGAPATAIARLKYEGRSELAPRLAAALLRVAAPLAGRVDVVVPVPLHPKRLAERGFNQSALLAGPVARALGVRHGARVLARTRDTPRQATLDRTARARNVSGAFAVTEDVAGLRVALVDDVLTTGATLDACARALAGAGAASVRPLLVASKA